jgi:hypothetical protein
MADPIAGSSSMDILNIATPPPANKSCVSLVRAIGYILTELQYIIVPFLLLFSFLARNGRTEEPHSIFRQNPFCQRENSDENESNDGLH